MTRTLPPVRIVAACLFWAVAAPVAAQSDGRRSPVPTEVTAATDFLLLAYPDLATRSVVVTVNRTGSSVAVSVSDAPSPGGAKPGVQEPLVNASFEFSARGELQTFAAQGVLLDRMRNEALTRTLAEHPTWTDSDAEAAMLALGGRPSTDTPPMTRIDAAKLGPFVGVGPEQANASKLQWRADREDKANQPFAATPGWTAEVSATSREGKREIYRLVFEPFGGRLVLVTRR